MPIPVTHMMDRLSVAYVKAVTARAGVSCDITEAPEYGIDARVSPVREVNGRFVPTGYIVNCQVKSTTTCDLKDGQIRYDMKVVDYNKIAEFEGGACILVLFWLPEDNVDWLTVDDKWLLMRKCCYWKHIVGPPSPNAEWQRVFIPCSQRFTPEAVVGLLDKVRMGEFDHGQVGG